MAVEYFTFAGNGEAVQGVFNAVATLSSSNTMTGALQAAALFGFLVTLFVAVYKIDLKDNFVYLFVIAGVWMGMMVPKTTVLITETAGHGFTGRQYTVGNVPIGLAYSANMVSTFGHHLTRRAEQIYNIPNELNYSQTGVLFGARLIEQIRDVSIPDATLTQDWALFMNQCSFFDLNLYHFYTVEDLRDSADILATLGNTNRAMFTNVSKLKSGANVGGNFANSRLQYEGGSTSMTCDKAYQLLKARTEFYSQGYLPNYVADKVFAGLGTSTAPNKATALATLGNNSFQYLLNNARVDTLKNIEQSAMVEIIRQSTIINGQRNNHAARVQEVFAFTQARNQYITAQKTGGLMASKNLPVVRSVAEAVLIGIFPFVVILALLAGIAAFKLIMFYVMALFWIQLWAPVASIINFVLTIHTRRLFNAETAVGMITPGSGDGLLMAAADAQAAAAGAMWLVPVISGALVMGGRTLLGALTGMATAAKSGAESAGSQAGTGNFAAGNMNYNNANANKYSLNPVYTDPQMTTAHSAAGTSWMNAASGTSRYQARNSSLAVSSQSQISESENYGRMADRAETAARQHQAAYQESMALGQAQTLAWAGKHSFGQSADSGYGMGLDAAQSQKMSWTQEQAQNLAQKHSYSNSSAIQSALTASLGIGMDSQQLDKLTGSMSKGMKGLDQLGRQSGVEASIARIISNTLKGNVQGGWKGDAINKDALVADIGKSISAGHKEGITFDSSFTDKVSSSAAYKNSLSSGDELAQGASASIQRAQQASRSATDSFNEAQSYREQAQRTYGNGKTVTYDNTNDLIANNPDLTLSQLNSGEGNTFQTAISTADRRSAQMDVAAQTAGWKSDGGLTPDSRPQNTVDSSYQSNVASVAGASQAAFEGVRERAARSGIRADSVDAAISKRGLDYEQDFNQARSGVDSDVAQSGHRYDSRVDDLANRARKADENSNGMMMELNSHVLPWNAGGERREQVMQDVRDGKGPLGSGANQTEAHLGRNPNLANDLKQRPGSGSRTFRPKQ
ncbi:conjugal transfer protein TraG [Neisseria brasiliensis]|uniref:conjugal transfer protein TraG N-terminal domain-containing protein n=1 Tax=Neisseria TaxID=482 RepID=UPI000C27B73B|nr:MULTISPECIES: conjugal transfer protein TraG N-terminal domain-containing protein [Neisseria]PJO79159.1 conjugal transfer protein TraG [Neisseria sp. N177_16]QGL26282.1 conjugal transfer protein TraG [Neisseria brasiliensis]